MRKRKPVLAALLLLAAAPAVQAQTGPPPPAASPAAEAYGEGQKHLASRTTAELRAARDSFERAITADSTFAPAFAGLAEAHALLYDYPRAKEAAGRALALDDRLADAHAVLAFARLHGDWDWSGAEAEFKRALELDSRRPVTHLWYAILLEATGRSPAAVAQARQAVDLAPDQAHVAPGSAIACSGRAATTRR